MIIGLVGPVNKDIEIVTELITEDKSVQVVNSVKLLRMSDRHLINSLTTQNYHKEYFLKKLENSFGTVIVTGNIILSEEICDWILQNEGIVIVVSREKLEDYDKEIVESTEKYWDEKAIQKYNLETRFKSIYERLSKSYNKDLFLVDLGSQDTSVLETTVRLVQSMNNSKYIEKSYENIINLVSVRKGDNTMTMEESIKKAMRDLGMNVDEDSTEEPKKHKSEKSSKKIQSESIKREPIMNPPEHEENSTKPEESEELNSVFVKLTKDTMALLIPVGLEMKKQVIGNMEFNVATVELPDFSSEKLQELEIKSQKPNNLVPRKETIHKSVNSKNKLLKVVVTSEDLEELHNEKARLDAEIKKYRAAGDIDTVNSLRKQRRAVRNKINKITK